jgi:Mg2+ and Co2+ transporter CorA
MEHIHFQVFFRRREQLERHVLSHRLRNTLQFLALCRIHTMFYHYALGKKLSVIGHLQPSLKKLDPQHESSQNLKRVLIF